MNPVSQVEIKSYLDDDIIRHVITRTVTEAPLKGCKGIWFAASRIPFFRIELHFHYFRQLFVTTKLKTTHPPIAVVFVAPYSRQINEFGKDLKSSDLPSTLPPV